MPYLTDSEASRKEAFRACPILESYTATMLEDAQFHENDSACEDDREPLDTSTIFTLGDSEFAKCRRDCERFMAENADDIAAAIDLEPGPSDDLPYDRLGRGFDYDRIGYYFYMVRVGHGVGFTDDSTPHVVPCLERLEAAARAFAHFDVYFGDDGNVYTT